MIGLILRALGCTLICNSLYTAVCLIPIISFCQTDIILRSAVVTVGVLIMMSRNIVRQKNKTGVEYIPESGTLFDSTGYSLDKVDENNERIMRYYITPGMQIAISVEYKKRSNALSVILVSLATAIPYLLLVPFRYITFL